MNPKKTNLWKIYPQMTKVICCGKAENTREHTQAKRLQTKSTWIEDYKNMIFGSKKKTNRIPQY